MRKKAICKEEGNLRGRRRFVRTQKAICEEEGNLRGGGGGLFARKKAICEGRRLFVKKIVCEEEDEEESEEEGEEEGDEEGGRIPLNPLNPLNPLDQV
jgi:hypothetical protein